MQKFTKWRRITYDGGISLEVGRLRYSEKPALAAMAAEVFGARGDLPDDIEAFKKEVLAKPSLALSLAKSASDMVSKIDPVLVDALFEHRVRNVQGVETEDGPVKTGLELLELVDHQFIMWVLAELLSGGSVTEDEGKASGSPSTSPVEGTPVVSASDAASTASADGPSPSTVEPTPPEKASSSRVA